MTVLPILISGEPVLHRPAETVNDFDTTLRTLVDNMFETTQEAPGVGLAAPQIGVSQRVFVWMYDEQDEAPSHGVAINPHLWITPTPPGLPGKDEEEGCLSFPGERFALRRSEQVLLSAYDIDGTPFQIQASGWFARIMQHEYDHLNGHLYVDRLAHHEHRQAQKIRRKNGWDQPGQSWTPGIDGREDER